MRLSDMWRLAAVTLVSALLAACASTGDTKTHALRGDANALAASRTLAEAEVSDAAWPERQWWKRYGDAQLDALMAETLAGSPTLRAADARVRKAVAAAGVAGAARSPQVNGSAGVTEQRYPEHGLYPPPIAGSSRASGDLTARLSYDLDLFGRNRSAYEGALDRAHAAQVDRQAAELLLSASVAHAYIALGRAYDQRDIARAQLAQRENVRNLVEQRRSAGIDSSVELKQAESALPEARERIAQLDESIALMRNQIAALMGLGPDRGLAIERPHLRAAAGFALPSRLPADLIGRRPEIVAQRWRIEAAGKDIDVAHADFYPNVNLVAFLGLQSIGLPQLLHANSTAAGVGPAVSLPIFEGGRLRSRLAGRQADYDIAVEQYNADLAGALRDVADQLASLRSIDRQRTEVDSGVAIAQQAYDLALLRFKEGLGNYLQVLSAESQVLGQKNLRAELAARELDVSVNLTRALGGGYDEPHQAPVLGALQ
jgi:NodT family efflux transporter outer membrane factor (OMF) lipoprotein